MSKTSSHVKKKWKSSQTESQKKQKNTEAILFAVITFLIVLVVGLMFYGFWTNQVSPYIRIFVEIISVLTIIWGMFGLKHHFPSLSQRLKKNFKFSSGGFLLSALLVFALHRSGFSIQLEKSAPVNDATGNSTNPQQTIASTNIYESNNGNTESLPDATEEQPRVDSSGISTDTDIVDPNTAITHVDTMRPEDILVPSSPAAQLLSAVDASLAETDLEHSPSNKEVWIAMIADATKLQINSDSEPDDALINGTKDFTDKTRRANQIEQEVQGWDVDSLNKIIWLREEAYDIYPTKSLRHLLASDYHDRARSFLLQKDWHSAYEYYLKSIQYEILYIRLLPEINDDYYKHLYNIAVLYQCIGDIPVIDEVYKTEAYYLSACFFELVCKNDFAPQNRDSGFLSSYYAGMVNHKLYLIGWRDRNRDCYHYLLDAFAYYEKSISFDDYRKQRVYQYDYLSQLCAHAQKYISYFGRAEKLKTTSEYKALEVRYTELAK